MNTHRAFSLICCIVWLCPPPLLGQPRITDTQRLQAMKEMGLVEKDPRRQFPKLVCAPVVFEGGDVDFDDTRDANLKNVKYLTELKSLSLHDTWVTDAGLAYLLELPGLEKLSLGTAYPHERMTIPISDEGMKHVGSMLTVTSSASFSPDPKSRSQSGAKREHARQSSSTG